MLKGGFPMYIVVETEDKKLLFESIREMDDELSLNSLYPKVKTIREVEREEFNQTLREVAKGLQEKRKSM
jgi:hypothetical protein